MHFQKVRNVEWKVLFVLFKWNVIYSVRFYFALSMEKKYARKGFICTFQIENIYTVRFYFALSKRNLYRLSDFILNLPN